MKKISLLLLALLLIGGCASPWQVKTTAGYISATSLVGTAENTVKPSCDVSAIPADKCTTLKDLYTNKIRPGIVAAGDTAKISFRVTDAVQQGTLMAQYQTLMTEVGNNLKVYIDLYTTLSKTPQGRLQLKYAISPELLQIIIAAVEAIVQNLPSIIAAINSWTVASVDIVALTAQIDAAQAALPAW